MEGEVQRGESEGTGLWENGQTHNADFEREGGATSQGMPTASGSWKMQETGFSSRDARDLGPADNWILSQGDSCLLTDAPVKT